MERNLINKTNNKGHSKSNARLKPSQFTLWRDNARVCNKLMKHTGNNKLFVLPFALIVIKFINGLTNDSVLFLTTFNNFRLVFVCLILFDFDFKPTLVTNGWMQKIHSGSR